jgi:outer membrane protease
MMTAVFLSCILDVYALDNLHFNVFGREYAGGMGTHWGVSGLTMAETVYADSSDDVSGRLLSEIKWDMGAQITAGVELNIAPADLFAKTGLSLGGSLWWHFPANDRSMKDTDWDDNGNKYVYGESIASALAGMEAEGRLAVHFPLFNSYLIEAAAEVWYGRYAVIAHDGWTSWAGSGEKTPLYGTAVEYIQEWVLFAPGLGLRRKLNNGHIGVRAAVSPLVWGYHIDNHYFRTLESDDPDQKYTRYTDSTKGGIFYMVQAEWSWNITRYVQTGITVNYRAIRNSRGDTTMSTAGLAGHSFLDKGAAGAAMRTIGVDLTVRTAL